MKKMFSVFLGIALLIMTGCTAAAPKVKTIETIPADKKVILIPAFNNDISVSRIVTAEEEKALNEKQYQYVPSSVFMKDILDKNLTNDYISFINAYKSLGVINPDFLKNFNYDYFIISNVDFVTSDRTILGSGLTESQLERAIKDSQSKVKANESWMKANIYMTDKNGTVVFEDVNEMKLSGAFGAPNAEKMAIIVHSPLSKLPGMPIKN